MKKTTRIIPLFLLAVNVALAQSDPLGPVVDQLEQQEEPFYQTLLGILDIVFILAIMGAIVMIWTGNGTKIGYGIIGGWVLYLLFRQVINM